MEITKEEKWIYPPTITRSGKLKRGKDIKHVYHIKNTLFNEPTIVASDLHQHTLEVVKKLCSYVDLSKFIVLTVGDMAGTSIAGSDGDPTEAYQMLAEHAKAFYFVQGNHDLPSLDRLEKTLVNNIGKKMPDSKWKKNPHRFGNHRRSKWNHFN